jgi:hypothetical protein
MATTQTVLSHWIQGREENSRSGKVVSSRWPEDAETKIDLAFPTAT